MKKTSNHPQHKPTVKIIDGPHKGKKGILLGTDFEELGRSIFGIKTPNAKKFFSTVAIKNFSILDPVYIIQLDDEKLPFNQHQFETA